MACKEIGRAPVRTPVTVDFGRSCTLFAPPLTYLASFPRGGGGGHVGHGMQGGQRYLVLLPETLTLPPPPYQAHHPPLETPDQYRLAPGCLARLKGVLPNLEILRADGGNSAPRPLQVGSILFGANLSAPRRSSFVSSLSEG